MARQYKCYWCEGKGIDEEMVTEQVGKQNKRYHKQNCYEKYIKDKEFKQQELTELNSLVETIKQSHDINIIPQQFYSFLQDVRNGNEMFGRRGQKKSKQGYTYKTVEETYKQCQSEINWAKQNKEFKNTLNMLRYTLAIIKNNINDIENKISKEARQKEITQSTSQQKEDFFYHVNNKQQKFRKSKSKIDASSFLD